MEVVNITKAMIKLQFKLPQTLISRGFTRRTVSHYLHKNQSHFEKVYPYPKTTPLIINRDDNLQNLPAINWGIENERFALKKFFIEEITKHEDGRVQKCGLW